MQREARRPGVFPLAVAVVMAACAFAFPAFANADPSDGASPFRTLVHVEARGQGDDASLVVVTDSPANFTSFKQLDPARAIIDFPETRSGPTVPVAGEAGSDAAIVAWRLRTFDEDDGGPAPLTRITIDLRPGRDFTIDADGTSLTLRTVPRVARPLIALVEPIRDLPEREREPEREASASLGPDEPPEWEAVAETPLPPPSTESETRSSKRGGASRSGDVVSLVPSSTESETRSSERGGASRSGDVVSLVPPSTESETRSSERGGASRSDIALDRLRFRRTSDGARLTLQTSEPVEYSLREASPTRLVLLLEDTHIPLATNRLPLDTRFFGTAVSRVVPRMDRAARRVSIDIELSGTAAYRAHRDDDELVVDFFPPRPDLSAELYSSGGGHP